MRAFLAGIGFIAVLVTALGVFDVFHVRVYVGPEDKVIVSRDKLKDPSE